MLQCEKILAFSGILSKTPPGPGGNVRPLFCPERRPFATDARRLVETATAAMPLFSGCPHSQLNPINGQPVTFAA
jgi:hypothetical protein